MSLQTGLILLGLVIFILVLLDALRRRRKAAQSTRWEDPEEAERLRELARELPNLKDWQALSPEERRQLDPLFDQIETDTDPDVFADDPIPVLRNKLDRDVLASLTQSPSASDDTAKPLTSSDLQQLFHKDPQFEAASRRHRKREEQLELALPEPVVPAPEPVAEAEPLPVSQPDTVTTSTAEEDEAADAAARLSAATLAAAQNRREQHQKQQQLMTLAQTAWSQADEFLTICLEAAADRPFEGNKLEYILQAVGLRPSRNGFYHFAQEKEGQPQLGYSVVNLFEPGHFPVDSMDSFTTRGIALVMTLPNGLKADTMLKRMLETAKTIKHNLGGELQDEHRSILTQQTLSHYQQRIQEFERRRHLHKARKLDKPIS